MKILVPLDGTCESETVVSIVMPIVRNLPSELELLRVIPRLEDLEKARAYLKRCGECLSVQGVQTNEKILIGSPVREILERARECRADVIAMCTHGKSGPERLVSGSVTEEVLRHSANPLMVNRGNMPVRPWKSLLVAVDGSALAEHALADAAALGSLSGSVLHVVRVVPADMPDPDRVATIRYLADLAKRLETTPGVRAVPVILTGEPGAQIVDYATRHEAGLIMLTTHGRTGLGRLLMGSVAEGILREAPCPVYVRRVVPWDAKNPGIGTVSATFDKAGT